ncbi:MAG: cbb3-type cytochrome oxidase assembly protein CcoS [Bacteroidota bacterium]|nr:cbb3-type cytochrome oxidase assembly protein CcoS [Bacteroidota bacterium]
MSVVFILVFVAIIMASAFLIAFIWAVRNGQYEDTYTPSVRILFDDLLVKKEENENEGKSPTPNPSPKGKGVS